MIAKVIHVGNCQAIVLPDGLRLDVDEVSLMRTTQGFLVVPRDPWEVFFEGVHALSGDFMADGRVQPSVEDRS